MQGKGRKAIVHSLIQADTSASPHKKKTAFPLEDNEYSNEGHAGWRAAPAAAAAAPAAAPATAKKVASVAANAPAACSCISCASFCGLD